MPRPTMHGGPAKWAAAGIALLLLASVVAFVSMAGGQQPSAASSRGTSRGGSPVASSRPAQDALDLSQASAAATAAAHAAAAPAASAHEAAPAAPSDSSCPPESVCNWPGPNETGHQYIDTNTFSCFGPTTVGSVSNNSDSDIAYLFDNATCQGDPAATVEPGDSDPSITPTVKGYALVDPAGGGNLGACNEGDLCLWEMAGYLGTMSVQPAPVDCLAATPASISNTSLDLVAYVYNSDDCSGPAASIDPGFSDGDLVDAAGDGAPQSLQVVELANPASPSLRPFAFAIVGTNAFVTFPDWDTCLASPATACYEYADGTTEGEIDPAELSSFASGGFLPAADLGGVLADLPLVGDGSDGCTSIPVLGSSPVIIAAFDNISSNQLVLGSGNCSDLEGADDTAGTDQVVGPDTGAVLAPVDGAASFDFNKCLNSAEARHAAFGEINYCAMQLKKNAPPRPPAAKNTRTPCYNQFTLEFYGGQAFAKMQIEEAQKRGLKPC